MELSYPKVGDVAPPAVLALDVPRPSLVVWLRHVGWRFFAEPLAQLRELDTNARENAIPVRCVTIGSQEKADDFCSRHNPAARCVGDPTMASYKAMGLEDFDLSQLQTNAALVQRRNENEAAGFRQDWAATKLEDAAQLPGAAAIDGDGVLRWIYRGTHPGDLPPMAQMLSEARTVLTL